MGDIFSSSVNSNFQNTFKNFKKNLITKTLKLQDVIETLHWKIFFLKGEQDEDKTDKKADSFVLDHIRIEQQCNNNRRKGKDIKKMSDSTNNKKNKEEEMKKKSVLSQTR